MKIKIIKTKLSRKTKSKAVPFHSLGGNLLMEQASRKAANKLKLGVAVHIW